VTGWGFDDDEPDEQAVREAEGGLAQLVLVRRMLHESLRDPSRRRVTPGIVCRLHREAMSGLLPTAGKYRRRNDVAILGSKHVLPPPKYVRRLLEEACEWVNNYPNDPILVAAFIMWRIAWIHPFDDGNGPTARAVSYLVLSQRIGKELPGECPLPRRIKAAPRAYVRALEAADLTWANGTLDMSKLQNLLDFYLTAQLRGDPPGLPPPDL